MITIIIISKNKKEIRSFKKKGIHYYLFILKNKLKGYDVQIIDNE